jgi:uncharacterized protein (DUF58 family)
MLVAGAVATLVAMVWPSKQGLQLAVLLLLAAHGLIGMAVVVDGWRGRSALAQVSRQPISRLSIGRDNPIAITVTTGTQPADLQIRDSYPQEQFTVSNGTLALSIPPQTSQDVTYTIRPSQRGEYQWGALHVRQRSPGKLVWLQRTLPQAQTVAVYPDLIGLRSLSMQLTLQSAGALRQKRRLGMGTEFVELREYSTGDDPRLIDWKATARRQRPLVRVLEPEQEQTLIILLDRGRLMTAQVQGLQRFDWGLNATLALALAGLARGDRVGVAVFDRTIYTWLPPQRGQHQLNHLIEQLTPIQPELLEPDYLGAVSRLVSQQTRRALVVLLTDIVDQTASAELLMALGQLTPRYLPFCVTLRDPQIDQQAEQFSLEVEDNFARAVALDLLAQRQMVFARLQPQGVLVLDAPANQISQQLVDRYLQLKLRNQL